MQEHTGKIVRLIFATGDEEENVTVSNLVLRISFLHLRSSATPSQSDREEIEKVSKKVRVPEAPATDRMNINK